MYLNLTSDYEVHRHFYLKVTSTSARSNTSYRHSDVRLSTFYYCCETSAAQHPPSQNTIDEMFSFLHFLHIKPLNNWKTFQEKIDNPVKCGHLSLAIQRLQVSFTLQSTGI